MRSLRILHVAPYYVDAWAYGGIPRVAGTIARGLVRRGHQVTVCTTDACDARRRLTLTPVGIVDGVEVRVFPNLSNRLAYHAQLFAPRGFRAYLDRHAKKFDVAHLHACRNLPGVIAARHLTRAGVPYVLAPNGTGAIIERRQLAKWIFDVAVGARVVAGASRVLAVSQAERTQLAGMGVPETALRVVPNPVDLEEFRAPISPGAFRARFQLPPGPLVMFLGKLTPRKRLDIVAQAMARLQRPDCHLVIAGNDMGAGAATRALIRRLGLDARTCFTDLLVGRQRLEALTDADVLVYPSQQEAFGLVPLESLLCGTPVVVANDSGCAEVVKATGGGQIVPVGDPEALAHSIARVLDDPEHWRSAAARAVPRIQGLFGADVVCAQLDSLYHDVIAATRA